MGISQNPGKDEKLHPLHRIYSEIYKALDQPIVVLIMPCKQKSNLNSGLMWFMGEKGRANGKWPSVITLDEQLASYVIFIGASA